MSESGGMRFTVVTLFPEMFESLLGASLLGKAAAAGLLEVDFVTPRDFTSDRHRSADDAPYGGGPGMVMKVEPVVRAVESATAQAPAHRVLLTPAGAPLTQRRVQALAGRDHILLVCGRYEGLDERISDLVIDEELSVGDFVMTGGEVAAMAVIDAVARYVPGVLGEATSTDEESFSDALIEYPQYTRPAEFRGLRVPEVLQSGDHGRIRRWRRAQALARTAARRPDLLARHRFTDEDEALARELAAPALSLAARTYVILAHHPVFDRTGRVVTTSVTNLDLHDIARSAATYGLAGFYPVTPITAQRDKVERILAVWRDQAAGEVPTGSADHRAEALAAVRAAAGIAEALDDIAARSGRRPHVVTTSADPARAGATPLVGFASLRAERGRDEAPLALIFGTGWGLTGEVVAASHEMLAPISGRPPFNHLSVRSAVAVVLDRLFGLREP